MTLKEIQALSDEDLRIKVAELCGYERFDNATAWWHPISRCSRTLRQLPKYTEDLNAVHEAALAVIHSDVYRRRRYYQTLDLITGDSWNTVDATARQRAEAFVRTMESAK